MLGMTGSVFQGGWPEAEAAGLGAATVNIGAPQGATTTEGTGACTWDITYSNVDGDTVYNLIAAEVQTNGTPTGVINVYDGTTSTPSVQWSSTSGTGSLGITILAGACQNDGVDNTESAASDTTDVQAK